MRYSCTALVKADKVIPLSQVRDVSLLREVQRNCGGDGNRQM
jgi:hypothetical protein